MGESVRSIANRFCFNNLPTQAIKFSELGVKDFNMLRDYVYMFLTNCEGESFLKHFCELMFS